MSLPTTATVATVATVRVIRLSSFSDYLDTSPVAMYCIGEYLMNCKQRLSLNRWRHEKSKTRTSSKIYSRSTINEKAECLVDYRRIDQKKQQKTRRYFVPFENDEKVKNKTRHTKSSENEIDRVIDYRVEKVSPAQTRPITHTNLIPMLIIKKQQIGIPDCVPVYTWNHWKSAIKDWCTRKKSLKLLLYLNQTNTCDRHMSII